MSNINLIIKTIDDFLEKKHKSTTTPVEISPVLELAGILKNSPDRPGLPLRRLLRAGKIPHAYQIGNKWHIPNSRTADRSQ